MRDLLLIDDDGDVLRSLARALSTLISPLTQCAAGSEAAAEALYLQERPKVVVLDLCLNQRLGVESGFSLLKRLLLLNDAVRIIVLTGHGSTENGIRALELGAASFLEKPADPHHLAALIRDGVKQASYLRERRSLMAQHLADIGALVGSSRAMANVREQVLFAASTDQPVLLIGETGTGKGVCARLIHEGSSRREKRFVPYHPNYGGADLVLSELCGHVKGAFTGALSDRRGLIREADGGTLFLDELDEIPKETQLRLLDVVQEKRVRAVGADSFLTVDCRVVAASNRSLVELLDSGKLRLDLYHRIAHNLIDLPPLRERIDDIPDLAQSFVSKFSLREGANLIEVSSDALDLLRAHRWPGNIRELQAVLESAMFRAKNAKRERVDRTDIQIIDPQRKGQKTNLEGVGAESLQAQLENFKWQAISEALAKANGNQVVAARSLGVDRGMIRRAIQSITGSTAGSIKPSS